MGTSIYHHPGGVSRNTRTLRLGALEFNIRPVDAPLWKRRCAPCEKGTPPISEELAAGLTAQVDEAWDRRSNQSLSREFGFSNFRDAFGLATRIALLAEEQGHHPEIEVGWGRLVVSLTTHVAGGLTENDFILAAKIDRLSASIGSKQP